MTINKNNSGFSLVEGLLTVIALALIVGVGLYVYNSVHRNSDKKMSPNTTSSSNPPTPHPATYLTIKELGIKLPLSEQIKDAEYEMAPDGQTAGISTKKFELAVADCKSSDTASSSFPEIVGVNKNDGAYDSSNPPFSAYSEFAVQLSGFYLMDGSPDGGYCNGKDQSKNKTANDLFSQLSPLIKAAVKKAQPI